MLRPQENEHREIKNLDGLWEFAVDRQSAGRREAWWQGPLPGARLAPVPSSYNDLFADSLVHDHVGDVWYQRTVHVPSGWAERRVVLRFDSATHRAAIWVDAVHVASHEGGYTPFEAEITELVQPGRPVRVTACVNNELTWQSIPPGIVETTEDGQRKQRYYHDFFNYAGLHRSVWLYSTPLTHIADLTVTTEAEAGWGTVQCSTAVHGPAEVTVTSVLRDPTGRMVAQGEGGDQVLEVADPLLWGPGQPNLYELDVELVHAGVPADRYLLPVGIRSVQVDGTSFLINGEPFYFRGFGKHEDLNLRGRGHDDVAMVHDFALLDWVGANSFRTSHYPYAEEVLDYADRTGVVVIDETAAVGLNLGVGGGFFLGGPKSTYSEETVGRATQEVHRRAIEELIARDKNHPCVVLWSIANEPESNSEGARNYFEPLFQVARRSDPTRPVGFVNMMLAPPDRCTVTELADVIMVNRYYGWYVEPGDLAAAERGLETELRAWAATHGKPIIVTEYGADSLPGLHAVDPVPWTEEYQAALLDTYHRVFDRVDAVAGEHVWNFADFETPPSFMRVGGNKKGVFTRERRPKAAAHHLRRRWRGTS